MPTGGSPCPDAPFGDDVGEFCISFCDLTINIISKHHIINDIFVYNLNCQYESSTVKPVKTHIAATNSTHRVQ